MSKFYFEKGYTGSEKDTIVQKIAIINSIATIFILIILRVQIDCKIIFFDFNYLIFILLLLYILSIIYLIIKKNNFVYGSKDLYENANYYRDIPNDNNIDITYALLYDFHIKKWDKSNIIGALLIKLVNDGVLELICNNGNYEFKIIKEPNDLIDKRFYSIIVGASSIDKTLQKRELDSYFYNNNESIELFYNFLLDSGRRKLYDKHSYVSSEKHIFENLTNVGKNELEQIYGFQKYIDDFSLLSERELKEIVIWDKYFIYSTLIGNVNNIIKTFNDFYPNEYSRIAKFYKKDSDNKLDYFDICLIVGYKIMG